MGQKSIYFLVVIIILVGCSQAGEIPNTQLPTTTSIPNTIIPEPIHTVASTAPGESPGLVYDNFEHDGIKRFHMVYIPESYNDTDFMPLVIYLHSYGWGAQTGMDYTQLNQVAEDYGFIIAYPNAKYNWNSGIGENPDWATPDNDDVGYIDAMIELLIDQYKIDAGRIYATGYSNGGFMAYKMACELSHRIAAIASVSGVISTSTQANCDPSRTIPILQIHGTNDSYVPMAGGTGWQSVDETLNFWIQNNDCKDTDTIILEDSNPSDECTVELISYTNCSNNSQVIFYHVINGGHTWPGAGRTGYPAGKTNQDINAGVEIWNFFKDFELPSTLTSSN